MRLLAFALAVMTTLASFGINHTDSVKVYFRVGHSQFDPSLGDNREGMDDFIVKAREALAGDDIESIVVRAYASPDGTNRANELLARRRCEAISKYIVDKSGISSRLIRTVPEGVAWDGLKELVEKTPEVPSREAVLDILNNTPIWVYDSNGKIVDGRKNRLMSLKRGVPYRWMLNHLFPKLRNAVAVTMVTKEAPESDAESRKVESKAQEPEVQEPEKTEDSEYRHEETDLSESPEVTEDASLKAIKSCDEQRFALKTNLLYWLLLLPNLELEWLINPLWSVSLEGDVAWYGGGTRKYRLAIVSPEVRYWALSRAPWKGMYVGLFGGVGMYDLENRKNGYLGEGVMAGVSVGYMFPIGKRLSLEAGIGAGYMYTRYKEYMPVDNHFLYMHTKTLNYFGPLKLKLSLAWRFGCKEKKVKIESVK